MDQIDWGNRDKGRPMHTYKIRLVTGEVLHLTSPDSLVEIKLQFLGRYTRHGIAINIEEVGKTP